MELTKKEKQIASKLSDWFLDAVMEIGPEKTIGYMECIKSTYLTHAYHKSPVAKR